MGMCGKNMLKIMNKLLNLIDYKINAVADYILKKYERN